MKNQWNHENSLNIYASSSYSSSDHHGHHINKKYNVKKYIPIKKGTSHTDHYKQEFKNEVQDAKHCTRNLTDNFKEKKISRHTTTTKKNPSVNHVSHFRSDYHPQSKSHNNLNVERPRLLLPNGRPVTKQQDSESEMYNVDIGDCSISDNPGVSHIKGINKLVAKAMKKKNIKNFSDILKLLVHLDNSRVGFAEWMFQNTNISSDDLQYLMDNLEKFIKMSFYKMDNGYDTDNLN